MKTTISQPASSKDALAARLCCIVEACEREARRLDRAAREVSNAELALLFCRYARRRLELAKELSGEVNRLRAVRAEGGAAPHVREGAKSAARGASRPGRVSERVRRPRLPPAPRARRDDATILVECERGEAALCAMYDAALAGDLPDDLPMRLRRQSLAVVDTCDQIHELQAALAWCAVPMAV